MFKSKHLHIFIIFCCAIVHCESDQNYTYCYHINNTDLFTISYLMDYYKYD